MTTTATTGHLPWDQSRLRLAESAVVGGLSGTPYFKDAVWPRFSREEYARRYAALRARMAERDLDCALVSGGPTHWSFGGGLLWLSGHLEWHSLSGWLVVPREGEPTLIFSAGHSHIESVRRETAGIVEDVRGHTWGRFGEAIAGRIRELGLERGRIGLLEVEPRLGTHMPVNDYEALRAALPEAELVLTSGIMHQLIVVHSAEEQAAVRRAGELCDRAMAAVVARARPGVTEYQLAASAAFEILDGGGMIDFIVLGSTSLTDGAMLYGNPRPSGRVLETGDLITLEISAGYNGYVAQTGTPICVGEPPSWAREFWEGVVKPGFHRLEAQVRAGRTMRDVQEAGAFYAERGGQTNFFFKLLDRVTAQPAVYSDRIAGPEKEYTLVPGMVGVVTPNTAIPEGRISMSTIRTYIVTEGEPERAGSHPVELVVVP
ncbi:MAG: M24 family metallopeptidase [Candidatus Dormibacteraceae bacterium]